jgi:chromosome segregation ATPase
MIRHLNKKQKCYETEIIYDGLKAEGDYVCEKDKQDYDNDNNEKEIINEPIEINISEPFLNKIKKLESIIEELTIERNELQNENKRLDDLIENRDEIIDGLTENITRYKEKLNKYKELSRALAVKEKVISEKKEEPKGMVCNKQFIKFL